MSIEKGNINEKNINKFKKIKKVDNISKLKIIALNIRKDIINMLYLAKSGHTAGSLGLADIFTVLYFDKLNHKPKNPQYSKRDFVILSNGHVCPVLYSVLARSGYFKLDELKKLRKKKSLLQGHPHKNLNIGIENSSGPLGQGISQAVGLAVSLKRDNKKNKVYTIVGDGELQEGQVLESFMFASKEKLDNLIVMIDRNNIQISGSTDDVCSLEPLSKKINSFGFSTINIDGNNISQIQHAIDYALKIKDKPVCIIANTIAGKGVSFIESNYQWHGRVPKGEEKELAIKELNKKIKEVNE
ncbi:MAG: transketolase [Nanoarchaeota archaeon]